MRQIAKAISHNSRSELRQKFIIINKDTHKFFM